MENKRTQFIDIKKLSEALGTAVCEALVGMHAFTGCDTVSAFAGRGKINAFNQMKSNKTYQAAYCELGRNATVSSDLFEKLQIITCSMYHSATTTTSVNTLRHQLFCA